MIQANVAAHLGREQEVTALGRTWKLARWDRGVWWRVLEWARGQVPDPLDAATAVIERMAGRQSRLQVEAKGKPPAESVPLLEEATILERRAEQLLRIALDKRMVYLSVNAPEIQALMDSLEGSTRVLWELLKPAHGEVTDDDAYGILQHLTASGTAADPEPLRRVLDTALGRQPAPTAGNA